MKKHGFWIIVGAMLLAEVGFLWFGVIARGNEIKKLQEDLEGKSTFLFTQLKKDEVPSTRLKDHYDRIKKSYGDHEQLVKNYYIDRDQSFEPENLGPLGEYRATYKDAMDHLETEFQEKTGAPEREGGKRRFHIQQGFEEPDMVLVEKRYRIQKELADILIRAGVKDLVQVKFQTDKKKEKKKLRKKGKEKEKKEEPLIEYDTHDVTAEIVCDFGTIPEILATVNQSTSIPFRLRRMLMRKDTVMGSQELEDDSIQFVGGNSIEKTFADDEREAYETLTDDQVFPEPAVELVLMLEVIDIREMAETPEEQE